MASPPATATCARPAPAPRARAWPPVAAAAGALAGCGLLAVVDPHEPGRYGLCPFYAVTGLWCPLCGSLRAVHHLTRADLAAAAGANLLLVLAAPVLAYAWLSWAAPRLGLRGPPALRLRAAHWWLLLALGLGFGVLRNLPLLAWLAPETVGAAR